MVTVAWQKNVVVVGLTGPAQNFQPANDPVQGGGEAAPDELLAHAKKGLIRAFTCHAHLHASAPRRRIRPSRVGSRGALNVLSMRYWGCSRLDPGGENFLINQKFMKRFKG